MFYLYQSNRLESLAALFCKLQQVQPLQDALAAEEIVVQSQGMRRYLSSYLAKELGVAANLKFSLPAGLTWRLMRDLIPDIPALSPFSPEVMRWRLLRLFRSDDFQTASKYQHTRMFLSSYLGSAESADYQLAGQLSDMFDQYLVYRPQWIDGWQEGKLFDLGEDEYWQAELWRYLDDGVQAVPHRVALWTQLLQALSADCLPERFFVFGISTMAPMYLQLLQKMAEHCDVFVFALNPSEQYWGNVIEAAQILKSSEDVDLSQSGHPLLASLGKQGRDFFDFLSEIELEIPVFEEVEQSNQSSLLHHLQHDIQMLKMPSENAENALTDGSIRLVSAHSPLRELQILKDQLLEILAQHADWQPHDIAVLTPNIERYTPFIEAVFGQSSQTQALPYSVSDVKLSGQQPLFLALEQCLALLESRFEVERVLPLLESELLLNRFELSREDLPLLHDTIAQLNVHWGLDEKMRQGVDKLFTWQQALERMILGWMLPEGGANLWQGVSAWHADLNQLSIFNHFAVLIQTLSDINREWSIPADVEHWIERIRRLLSDLFLPSEQDQYALQQFEQALVKWQEEVSLANFGALLPKHTVIRHLSHFLNSENQAGFLRGGITFCGMVPMRSLPFKVLCLLGLNDGDFPRNTKAAFFDLIAKHPMKGDRARRDDDRYLFLEAIMSAREILYLSYIGRHIRNDDELAASALVSELMDTIAAMTGKSSKYLMEHWVIQHPLQAFSTRYFQEHTEISDGLGAHPLFSSRQDYAEALNQASLGFEEASFFTQPLTDTQPLEYVTHREFILFWKNPVKVWLQKTLGWREPYRDEAWESVEPFEPKMTNKITEAYREARRHHVNFEEVAIKLRAESLLPAGELGNLWQQKFQSAAKQLDETLLQSQKYPPIPYDTMLGETHLHGSFNHIHQCGQIFYLDQKPTNPNLIELMLTHLIFCAIRPSEIKQYETYLVQTNETLIYPEITQKEALSQLQEWMKYFHLGQNRPLPFFAKTSLVAAEAYLKNEEWEEAEKAAYLAYHGNKVSKGQNEYTEVNLVFGQDEVKPIKTELFANLIKHLLVPLLSELSKPNSIHK